MGTIDHTMKRAREQIESPAERMRSLMQEDRILITPAVYDALSAKCVVRAGFELTFMTGFGVSAVRGYPDTQLVSYGEMLASATDIAVALEGLPCIGDGDTGYGNCVNVKRTIKGYGQAGMACVMIEDQVAPKRCGHVAGKTVVSREEAVARIRAACDARDEMGAAGPLIMARTDARCVSMDEAIARCIEFKAAGCDVTFLEAPESVDEMERYCKEVEGPKMANMVPNGRTPVLSASRLHEMGYKIALHPVDLLCASVKAMEGACEALKAASDNSDSMVTFGHLKEVVGFPKYHEEEARYATK